MNGTGTSSTSGANRILGSMEATTCASASLHEPTTPAPSLSCESRIFYKVHHHWHGLALMLAELPVRLCSSSLSGEIPQEQQNVSSHEWCLSKMSHVDPGVCQYWVIAMEAQEQRLC
jgi:hypothetical protein